MWIRSINWLFSHHFQFLMSKEKWSTHKNSMEAPMKLYSNWNLILNSNFELINVLMQASVMNLTGLIAQPSSHIFPCILDISFPTCWV